MMEITELTDLKLPPRSSGNLSVRHVLLVTPEMDAALRKFCEDNNTTVSGFLRTLLKEVFDLKETGDG